MDKQQFMLGLPFSDYLDKMTDARREGFWASYQAVKLSSDDLLDLAIIDAPLFAAAFSEDWCGDCQVNLPVMAKLAEAAPHWELRCFSKEAHADLAKELQIERIPTLVILNSNFQEVGRWIERPTAMAEALIQNNEQQQRLTRAAYHQGRFHADTIEEILDLLH